MFVKRFIKNITLLTKDNFNKLQSNSYVQLLATIFLSDQDYKDYIEEQKKKLLPSQSKEEKINELLSSQGKEEEKKESDSKEEEKKFDSKEEEKIAIDELIETNSQFKKLLKRHLDIENMGLKTEREKNKNDIQIFSEKLKQIKDVFTDVTYRGTSVYYKEEGKDYFTKADHKYPLDKKMEDLFKKLKTDYADKNKGFYVWNEWGPLSFSKNPAVAGLFSMYDPNRGKWNFVIHNHKGINGVDLTVVDYDKIYDENDEKNDKNKDENHKNNDKKDKNKEENEINNEDNDKNNDKTDKKNEYPQLENEEEVVYPDGSLFRILGLHFKDILSSFNPVYLYEKKLYKKNDNHSFLVFDVIQIE